MNLRQRAESIMSSKETDILELTFPKARQMLHDLQTYQIELELQNEELQKTQEDLHFSRQRYASLYDFAPVGYLTISSKGMILEANLTVAEMLGVQRGSLIQQPLSTFIAPVDQDSYFLCRNLLLDSQQEQICELHMKREDGSLFYAMLQTIITPEVDGDAGQFRTIITDISFQKIAEEKINSLAKFPDENTSPVLRVRKNGEIMYRNIASLPMLADWNCEVGSRIPDDIVKHIKKSLSTEIVQEIEVEHSDKIFILSVTPIPDFEYVNLYGYDITNLRKTEKALLESEEKFQSLYFAMSEGVCLCELVYDKAGQAIDYLIVDVNPSFEKIIGFKRDEVIGRTSTEILNQTEAPYLDIYGEVAETGKAVSFETYYAPLEKHFHISVFSPGKERFATVFSDITKHIHMEEELKSSAEAIKFFAYSVVHDLKNPAIANHLLTKALCEKHSECLPEKGKMFCRQILNSSEEIVALVEKINTFIETKESPLIIELISLDEIVKTVIQEYTSRLNKRKIAIVEPKASPETLWADRLAILRVLRNLVDNSLKYGGDSLRTIEFQYKKSKGYHVLSISDDGRGIGNAMSQDLFELFRRNKGTQKIPGVGLGLAIVKEVAAKHGGSAWIEHKSGKGITVCISIKMK